MKRQLCSNDNELPRANRFAPTQDSMDTLFKRGMISSDAYRKYGGSPAIRGHLIEGYEQLLIESPATLQAAAIPATPQDAVRATLPSPLHNLPPPAPAPHPTPGSRRHPSASPSLVQNLAEMAALAEIDAEHPKLEQSLQLQMEQQLQMADLLSRVASMEARISRCSEHG